MFLCICDTSGMKPEHHPDRETQRVTWPVEISGTLNIRQIKQNLQHGGDQSEPIVNESQGYWKPHHYKKP